MDAINILNLLSYIAIGILAVFLLRKRDNVAGITLLTLAFHGLLFNIVFFYRDLTWVECPPICGLQEWSSGLRSHSLLSIITVMVYRIISWRA